jgi:UDP-3-O-[3-hydroxymyristoyl] N-acetylglucosamine deacetylase
VNLNPNLEKFSRRQRTLKKKVTYSGIGIHTGQVVDMTFCPAGEGEGISFQRVDLPSKPLIPATIEYVQDTSRSTTIGIGSVQVHTIEHVLAALKAYEVDNLRIELTSSEPPVGDGSSGAFVDMILEGEVVEQNAQLPIVKIDRPIYWSQGSIHLVALPAEQYCVSYTLHYPHAKALRSQYYSLCVTSQNFTENIAPCRTFALYDEVAHLMDRGLIRGGSLENAVIVKDDAIFSKEGLKFQDEMVRHKILDLIGDLSLIGIPVIAHMIAICSGHPSNVAFAKNLYKHITMEKR